MVDPTGALPIISLTTDFGREDTYVGQMKGVILGIAPAAHIVDVTHDVRPQQIRQGAFLAQTAWPAFPKEAIHVAVVDPGVGTERRGLVVVSERGIFIGPDNGILSAVLADGARPIQESCIELPSGLVAYEIANAALMRREVSPTFHGRDVLSPVAAHLAIGMSPDEVGPMVKDMTVLPSFRATRSSDGGLSGTVVHVDRYGNAITDMRSEDLPERAFVVEIAEREIHGPYRTFADLKDIGAIVGGSGYLGIAAPNGNAAEQLHVDIGASVRLRPSD